MKTQHLAILIFFCINFFGLKEIHAQYHCGEPNWSHDGKRIVFVGAESHTNVEGQYPSGREIWIMNENGSNKTQLTNRSNHANEYPALSPDNHTILFSSNESGHWKLYTINADGSGKRDIGIEPTSTIWNDPCRTDWSPDGKHFVFPITNNGERTLHIADADGSNIRAIDNAKGLYPDWSPDGKSIVYYRKGNIHSISIDGSHYKQLTDLDATSNARACYPQWSPDGKYIYYLQGENILRMNADGSDKIQISNIPGPKWYIEVSPQNKIIYGGMKDNKDVLYVYDINDNSCVLLSDEI